MYIYYLYIAKKHDSKDPKALNLLKVWSGIIDNVTLAKMGQFNGQVTNGVVYCN